MFEDTYSRIGRKQFKKYIEQIVKKFPDEDCFDSLVAFLLTSVEVNINFTNAHFILTYCCQVALRVSSCRVICCIFVPVICRSLIRRCSQHVNACNFCSHLQSIHWTVDAKEYGSNDCKDLDSWISLSGFI